MLPYVIQNDFEGPVVHSRARTGSGLSDFFMVGLSDGLSNIRYPTSSCTIRRVV